MVSPNFTTFTVIRILKAITLYMKACTFIELERTDSAGGIFGEGGGGSGAGGGGRDGGDAMRMSQTRRIL